VSTLQVEEEQQPEQPQQQPYLPQNNYLELLIDEANKLYTFLAERFLCDIVNENVSKQSISSVALPTAALPPEEVGGSDDDKLGQNEQAEKT
jgi:hypothetical protein